MKSDLTGKVSLITGSARGIGQAIANRFAANGSKVVFADIDGAVPKPLPPWCQAPWDCAWM